MQVARLWPILGLLAFLLSGCVPPPVNLTPEQAVAACEAGVALALILMLYRRGRSLDVSKWQDLRELGVPAAVDLESLPVVHSEPDPTLTPAGARPAPVAEEPARV